jgi:tRNA(Phe) wybutosine-synthesizing methylase Tyw3
MKEVKKILSLLYMLSISTISIAQDTKSGMADLMRSNGRIYVVVAVILTIFAGLILYVIRIDRKLSRLEKDEKPD